MADNKSLFGPDATDLPELHSAQTPKEGVVKRPALLLGLASIFDQTTTLLENKKAKDKDKILGDFIEKQLLIADALDQGEITSSAHARTMLRKNLLEAVDLHPSLAADLINAQSGIVNLPGGGDIVKEGDEQEQLNRARKAQLVSAGLLSPDATDDEYRRANADAMSITALTEQHNLKMQSLEERKKVLELGSAERAEIEAVQKEETRNFVRQIAPSEFLRVKKSMEDIIVGEGTNEEKIQLIEEVYSEFLSGATSLNLDLSSEDSSVFLKPFESLKEDFLKRASGEYSEQELKDNVERRVNEQKFLLMQDPEIARLVASSQLIGTQSFFDALLAGTPVVKKLGNFIGLGSANVSDLQQPTPFVNKPEDKKALASYLKILNEGIYSTDPTIVTESEERIKRVLSSVEDFEGLMSKDPTSAIELVNWFASGDFARLKQEKPQLFEQTQAARSVLERHYDDEVWGMINREFLNNQVIVPAKIPTRSGASATKEDVSSLVSTKTTPLGMEFIANDPKNKTAVSKAKELNKELKPVINTQIRAWAHLDGRTDYGSYWEEMSSTMLGTDVGSDKGDDISFDSFSEDIPIKTSKSNPLTNSLEGASSMVKEGAVEKMQETLNGPFATLQASFGKEIIINDAIAKTGTSREKETKGSRHFHGDALDISTRGMSDEEKLRLFRLAKEAGFTGFGFGETILHIDLGPKRAWSYRNNTFGGLDISDLITEANS